MNYLYRLEKVQPADRSLIGDKAHYLGLLNQQGCPIIPGIVVSAAALQNFLEEVNWQAPIVADLPHSSLHVDVDQPQQLRLVAQQIRQTLMAGLVSPALLSAIESAAQPWHSALIFRPSFTLKNWDVTLSHRAAGLLESHLCSVNSAAIAACLKQTWAELFRARSLLYWQRLGVPLQQINLAVLIQPIGAAIASGDVQIQGNTLNIRSTWGLGEAIVKGEVVPDRYCIYPQAERQTHLSRKLYAYQISTSETNPALSVCYQRQAIEPERQSQSSLTQNQIQQLKDLAQRAAASLRAPVSLEWTLRQMPAHPQPELYITQAAPQVSVLHPPQEAGFEAADPSAVLIGQAASRGTVAALAWVHQPGQPIAEIPPGVILITALISPDQVIELRQVAGIVTEQGGITSHAAILARELKIPAVVGVKSVTQRMQTGDRILISGDRGEVHLKFEDGDLENQSLPTPSFDHPKTATQLLVTLSQPTSAQAASLPVAGVGLLRSELLLTQALQNQGEALSDRIAELVQPFAAAFAPRPVFYRSLDLRSQDFSQPTGLSEPNPMLGVRGAYSYQINPALFEQELAALRQLQQRGHNNLHLILPFVRTVEEFIFCRQKVAVAGLTQNPRFQLWIMAEVPSVLLLLPDYVKAGVQGIAIGSNDLTQLLLGVDRDHAPMQPAFDQHHPAVMRAIQYLIQTAQQLGISCSICGQAPNQYPEIIESLIRWGITGISVDPADVERTHSAILWAERRLNKTR